MNQDVAAVDDLELVKRAQAGDADAFTELVGRHQDRVFAVARRMLPNHEDALDVSQEAFLKAYRGLARFKTDASFSTWLHRIVLNACTSWHRKRMAAKRGTAVSLSFTGDDGEALEMALPGSERQPHERALSSEASEAVLDALAELDAEYSEILMLRDIEGLSYQEVAEALGLADGTVRSRLHRGRKELARILRQRHPELVPPAEGVPEPAEAGSRGGGGAQS